MKKTFVCQLYVVCKFISMLFPGLASAETASLCSQFNSIISKYKTSAEYPFDSVSNPQRLCKLFSSKWSPQKSDRCNVSAFGEYTLDQIEKKFGYTVDRKTTLNKTVEDSRKSALSKVKKNCCKSNERCKGLLDKVLIQKCEPPKEAERFDKKDQCFYGNFYTLSDDEFEKLEVFKSLKSGSSIKITPNSSEYPLPGFIQWSPFKRDGRLLADEAFFVHEYTHACQSVLAQELVFSESGPHSRDAFTSFPMTDNFCELKKDDTFYPWFFKNIGEVAKGEVGADVCQSEVCEKSMYLEFAAIAMSFSEINSRDPVKDREDFKKNCDMNPRAVTHPRGGDVFECLALTIPSMKDRLESQFCFSAPGEKGGGKH